EGCSLAHRGASSRDDPEGGARRGVLRRRLITVGPGRPGTPPARHYDLAARSSLHGSGRQMPAVVGRRAPKEAEAPPRDPKPPRGSATAVGDAHGPRAAARVASISPGIHLGYRRSSRVSSAPRACASSSTRNVTSIFVRAVQSLLAPATSIRAASSTTEPTNMTARPAL